jgi:L-asparaginase
MAGERVPHRSGLTRSTPGGRRAPLIACALALVAMLPGVATSAADRRPPHVRVVATGGTISNAPTGRLTAAQLVAALPATERLGRIDVDTFATAPSAGLTLEDCVGLSRHLVEVFAADPDLDGIVVTMGTDTLEEIAWFLHLTVPGERPVVVVGAMRRPSDRDADGTANLVDAVTVAGSPRSRGRGTLVVMHGQIHTAREARKRHATDVAAFDAPEGERLGTVRRGRVHVSEEPAMGPRPGSLALSGDAVLPRVDVLLTYQGASGDLIDAAIQQGARGIVLAAGGAGALTPSQTDAAQRAARAGLPVVVASRTGGGRVMALTPAQLPIIAAGDLTAVKARLVLMLALAQNLEGTAIAALFETASP